MKKKTILSGIQPTGNLHIGNYLGAVKNWVDLQNSGEYHCFYMIASYHSLIGDMTPKERRDQMVTIAAELIAAGIDPNKSTLFVQSEVPAIAELTWILNCVTPMAELERMTQFKDKQQDQAKNINLGLFSYPVLQAADIMMPRATHVPVGEDQKQHVELTRSIARWFNNRYGKYFPEPKVVLTETPRIKSLLDPEKKMSKSAGLGHVIELADEPKVIAKKLKKAVTATEGGGDAPGVANLLLLLQHFADSTIHKQFAAAEKDGSIRYGDLKSAVSDAVSEHFAAFRERRRELLDDHNEIAEILAHGTEQMQAKANETMTKVREMVGLA